jgi:RNA polymerase sigma factor (sigma-70 family)
MSVMTTTSNNCPEGKFTELHRELRNGRRSIDNFLSILEVKKRLSGFCNKYDFAIFDGAYSVEDLLCESFEKVRKSAPKLKPENTPNECAFLGWLKTVVHNTFLDARRKLNKLKNHGQSRSDNPSDLLDAPTPEVGYDGKYFLARFLKFIERFPEAHQHAAEYWLAGCSYREIAEALADEGIPDCCHGTARNWVKAMLKAFKEDLGDEPPNKPRKP